MEVIINNTRIKYEGGEIWSYITRAMSKNYKWYLLKGSLNKENGYKTIRINKIAYPHHRVVYKLHNPEWNIEDRSKKNKIDHIDKNRANNNINNLRVLTQQQNLFNTNAKGYRKKRNKWQAYICVNYKTINLGCFVVEEDARNAYLEAKKKYHLIV